MADLPCPNCGSSLTFLDQYQRYYCHRCFQYAPEGYGDRGAQKCPTCGGVLSYVRQYGRMYCYHCNAYPQEQPAAPAETKTAPAAPPQPAPEPAAPATSAEAPAVTPVESASATTVLVAPPAPPPKTPKAEPAPEEIKPQEPAAPPPSPEPPTEPETPPAVPEVMPAPAPVEPVAPTPSREMQALATQKPAAVRVKLFALKKAELVDLCLVYHLDTSGSKEDLQDRLLSHLHDLEAEPAAEKAPTPEEIPPAERSPAPATSPTPEPASPETVPTQAATAAPAVIVEPRPAPVAAAPAAVAAEPTPVVPETPRLASRAEHPCPTCGRELTYISQYNRYYCYSCQRYAPAGARAKNACPTCGSTMRWIDQHRRWWCDSCQRYASADLPAPGAAAVAAVAVSAPVTKAIVVHRHGSPAGGAGLVGFGLALYIVYAFFGFLGDMLGFVRPASITTQTLDALQFFAFLLVALGAIVGLYGLRDRE